MKTESFKVGVWAEHTTQAGKFVNMLMDQQRRDGTWSDDIVIYEGTPGELLAQAKEMCNSSHAWTQQAGRVLQNFADDL
jgi:hypothetical protein